MSTLYAIRYDTFHTFIIVMPGVMNYSLLMSNLVAFYAKLNEILKLEFHFALKVSFSIFAIRELN